MIASRFISYVRWFLIGILVACGVLQMFIDGTLLNLTCTIIAIITSVVTIYYTFDVWRFRRSPFSSLMLFGYNVSTFSASLLIQTSDNLSLTYNLTSALPTFLALSMTQAVALVVHWIYLHSASLLGLRFRLSRGLFRPLKLLSAPTDVQLWIFGLVGCFATVISARGYSSAAQFGNVSDRFLLGYVPFNVAPFLIPLRGALLGGTSRLKGSSLSLLIYAPLLIVVAMANNARATFSSGFLTLILCIAVAVLSGNLRITQKVAARGLLFLMLGLPLFSVLSDLATAMVIARDERSNVSSMELIDITLSNFQDKALIEDRRRRDAAVLGGDYNENYVSNPLLARFVYTKFADVNMTNALALSDGQAGEIRKSAWTRIVSTLPTPILNYLKIDVDKSEILFSSGDVYSFIARGLEVGSFTTGSEVPDGLTIFGFLFWPFLSLMLIIQFIIYDAMSAFDQEGNLRVSALALLNVVPIFTIGVMQESAASQVDFIVRGIPQLMLLYMVIGGASYLVERLALVHRSRGGGGVRKLV